MKDAALNFLEGAVETVVENIITQSPYHARQHIQALVERIRELEEENAALRRGMQRPRAHLPATIEPEPEAPRPKAPGDPWAVPAEPEAKDDPVKGGRYR
jgi:hypothetical protein